VKKDQIALKKPKQVTPFDQILLEAIDEALLSLGENVKTSIYFHLDNKFKIMRSEIPSKINDFSDALERIFSSGAGHLEILFMKNLHSKLSLHCEWPSRCKWVLTEVTFQEYVCLMRHKFEEISSNQKEIDFFVGTIEEQAHIKINSTGSASRGKNQKEC